MARVKRFVTVGAAVAAPALVAVVAMSGASTAQQTRPVSDVNVVNPVESPVPVAAQGTTQVGGTVNVGNLPGTQAVSGTVDIGNLPTTQTVNGIVGIDPRANTVRLDPDAVLRFERAEPAMPFQAEVGLVMDMGEKFAGGVIDVPDGYRMVVEQFSAWSPSGVDFSRAGLSSGGNSAVLFIVATGGTATDQVMFRQARAGDLSVHVDRFNSGGSLNAMSVSVNVMGYLIPEPSTN